VQAGLLSGAPYVQDIEPTEIRDLQSAQVCDYVACCDTGGNVKYFSETIMSWRGARWGLSGGQDRHHGPFL
jgi:hypothetical protein